MGGVTVADGGWTIWQALLFLLFAASFVAFAALFLGAKLTTRGRLIAASFWGRAIVFALVVTFLAFLAGQVLPQLLPAAPPA